ncbi:MAG TPA: sodium:proton antiporter [Rubrobacteraceae bacterium]|nr:sodium:proton antiporter [Rubrobacteraceae bacterium]
MIVVVSLVISVIFGAGVFLVLQRDLLRVVVGIVLISNSANLFIIAAGLSRGRAPIYPLSDGDLEAAGVSDPLVQAMALTAIVISFSVAALLLALVYRLYASHGTSASKISPRPRCARPRVWRRRAPQSARRSPRRNRKR